MTFDFQKLGRDSCGKANAQTSTLEQHLNVAYDEFLKEERLDIEGIKKRISELKDEVSKFGSAINNYLSNKKNLTDIKIPRLESDISKTQSEINKLEESDVETSLSEYLPLVIGAFITICLTLFLFVFYSSVAYGTYFGISCDQKGIIDFDVFSKAKNKGGLVLTLIVLFPMIFLGLGFLIHDAIKKKKFLIVGIMLIVTLLVDFIIGYKLSHELYLCNESNTKVWEFGMIFQESNFYFVLVSGFAAYVLWGALLNYTLNQLAEIEPDKVVQKQIEQLQNKLAQYEAELDICRKEVNEIDAKIASNQANVAAINSKINAFENGGTIPIDTARLKAKTGMFMQGWVSYIELMQPQTAGTLTNASIIESDNWLNQKIQSLT